MNEIRSVRFLNLSINDEVERNCMQLALSRCLDHGQLVMGREIENLVSTRSR